MQAYKLFFIALNVAGMPKLTVMFAIVLSILSILFETAGLSMIFPAISYLNNDGDMVGLISEFPLWQYFEKVIRFLGLTLNFESTYIGFVTAVILAREFWVAALRDMNARNNNINATKVTFVAKIKTAIQLLAIGTYLAGLFFNSVLIIFIADFILFLALLITIKTGLEYTVLSFLNHQ